MMTQTPELAAPAERFSPSDAVFSAFTEWGRRPGRFHALLGVYLLAGALIAAPWAVTAWRDLGEGVYPYGQAATFRVSGALLSLYSLLLFPLNAVILAALLRLMLPRDPRPSFAHDAFMVLVIQIVVTMLAVIVALLVLVVGLLLTVLAFTLAAMVSAGTEGAAPSSAFAAGVSLLPLVLLALLFVPMLYLMLRFCLAPALTVAEGRLRLFQSWPVTRGFALALFGAHLLRFVLAFVIWVVVAAVLGLAGIIALGPDIGATFEAFATFTAPPPRALGVIAVFAVLYWLVMQLLEFLTLAMGAGIGASFLKTRASAQPVDAPAAGPRGLHAGV
jgi:hypothetical protein